MKKKPQKLQVEYFLRDRKARRWRKIDLHSGRLFKVIIKPSRGRKWRTVFIGSVLEFCIESNVYEPPKAMIKLKPLP